MFNDNGGLPTLLAVVNMFDTANSELEVQIAAADFGGTSTAGTASLVINLDPVGSWGPIGAGNGTAGSALAANGATGDGINAPTSQYTYNNIGDEGAAHDGYLNIGPDITGAPGYGTFNLNVISGSNALELGTEGSQSLNVLNIKGAGNLILDTDDETQMAFVEVINASTMTGNLIISGLSGFGHYIGGCDPYNGYYLANPETGTQDTLAGFLAADSVLYSLTTGSGNDWVNITAMDLADILNPQTVNGNLDPALTVNLGAGINELVVDASVADTTVPLTFWEVTAGNLEPGQTIGASTVQILGIADLGTDNFFGPSGIQNTISGEWQDTVNMANLPGVNEIQLIGHATQLDDLIITHGANNLTVDVGDAPQPFAFYHTDPIFDYVDTFIASTGSSTGTTWTLNFLLGEPGGENAAMGTLTVNDYEIVNLTSNGSNLPTNEIAGFPISTLLFFGTYGENFIDGINIDNETTYPVTLNISGTENLYVGDWLTNVNDQLITPISPWTDGEASLRSFVTFTDAGGVVQNGIDGALQHSSILLGGNGTTLNDYDTGAVRDQWVDRRRDRQCRSWVGRVPDGRRRHRARLQLAHRVAHQRRYHHGLAELPQPARRFVGQ